MIYAIRRRQVFISKGKCFLISFILIKNTCCCPNNLAVDCSSQLSQPWRLYYTLMSQLVVVLCLRFKFPVFSQSQWERTFQLRWFLIGEQKPVVPTFVYFHMANSIFLQRGFFQQRCCYIIFGTPISSHWKGVFNQENIQFCDQYVKFSNDVAPDNIHI